MRRRIVTTNLADAAIIGPDRDATVPTGILGETCKAKIAWTSSTPPSFITWYAPPLPSSAGWKTRFTVPFQNKLKPNAQLLKHRVNNS